MAKTQKEIRSRETVVAIHQGVVMDCPYNEWYVSEKRPDGMCTLINMETKHVATRRNTSLRFLERIPYSKISIFSPQTKAERTEIFTNPNRVKIENGNAVVKNLH